MYVLVEGHGPGSEGGDFLQSHIVLRNGGYVHYRFENGLGLPAMLYNTVVCGRKQKR